VKSEGKSAEKPWRKSPPISAAGGQRRRSDKLQMEAYTEAGLPEPPHTKMEKMRRDTLPPQHEKVMNLNREKFPRYSLIRRRLLHLQNDQQGDLNPGRCENGDPHHNLQPAISRAHEKISRRRNL